MELIQFIKSSYSIKWNRLDSRVESKPGRRSYLEYISRKVSFSHFLFGNNIELSQMMIVAL